MRKESLWTATIRTCIKSNWWRPIIRASYLSRCWNMEILIEMSKKISNPVGKSKQFQLQPHVWFWTHQIKFLWLDICHTLINLLQGFFINENVRLISQEIGQCLSFHCFLESVLKAKLWQAMLYLQFFLLWSAWIVCASSNLSCKGYKLQQVLNKYKFNTWKI